MIYKICAVRDRAVDVFGQPVFVANVGGAIRSFGDQINAKDNNPFAAHPEDYDLYQLGEFNDEDGTFTTFAPRQIAVGKDFVK